MGLYRPNGGFVGPGARRAREVERSYRNAENSTAPVESPRPLTRREKRIRRAMLHKLMKKR